jgi:hypothetical protein
MSLPSTNPAQENEIAPHWEELDKLIADGWPGLLDQIGTVSLRLLEILATIHVHRKPAMSDNELRENGLMGCDFFGDIFDFLGILGGFKPCKSPTTSFVQANFDLTLATARESFPSNELLKEYLKTIEFAFHLTVDAAEILAQRPGMPTPTFEQLVSLYVELGRLKNVAKALTTAASEDLSSSFQPSEEDLFGVGVQLTQVVNRIIPPRCVPNQGKLSLPIDPSRDEVLAAYLLANHVIRSEVCFEFVDDSFDASRTNTRNHATIAVGTTPYHAPESLCFDNRAVSPPVTNTQLVIQHAAAQGIPMDFTDGMSTIAAGDENGNFSFETDLIGSIFEACDTPSLAMTAAALFLDLRFSTSEAFNDYWSAKRLAMDSDCQSYLPTA